MVVAYTAAFISEENCDSLPLSTARTVMLCLVIVSLSSGFCVVTVPLIGSIVKYLSASDLDVRSIRYLHKGRQNGAKYDVMGKLTIFYYLVDSFIVLWCWWPFYFTNLLSLKRLEMVGAGNCVRN